MDFREALQAGKIGIGGASDHWSRLFAQKVLGGYVQGYAEGAIASFTDGVSAPVDKLLVAITPVQTGTGDPSPDNVRPISGWTGANVQRTGVNIWNEFTDSGNISSVTGNNTSSDEFLRTGFIPVKPGVTYFFHSEKSLRCRYYDFDKNYIGYTDKNSQTSVQNNSRTVPDNCYYMRFTFQQNVYRNDISVNYPDTDTAYHAYTGTTYPITFPSEAGTVYGGELDVTSGVLRVTYANIASYAGETINEPWISSMDKYVAGATPTTGAQVVYPLATPLTYQLTPTEVTTLLGVNNVWADTGDVKIWYKKKK